MTAADLVYLKDAGEHHQSKEPVFVPFFGAFLTFLVAKSQYIIDNGDIVMWVEIAITFC